MSAPGGAPISSKLTSEDVKRLKAAIEAAETVDEITRLERVLLTGRIDDVADLLRREGGGGDVLSSLWADTRPEKQKEKRALSSKPATEPSGHRVVPPLLAVPLPKRPRLSGKGSRPSHEVPKEVLTCLHTRLLIRARLSGNSRGLEPVIDPDADIRGWASTRVLSRDSPVKEDSTGSSVEAPHRRRDVIAISVGMCSTLDPTDGRTLGRELCRVVVRDCSENNEVLLDVQVKPVGHIADMRPHSTGLESLTESAAPPSVARQKVMDLMHSGTVVLCMSMLPAKALEIRHECWLPMTHLFEMDSSRVNKDDVYVKLPLTHRQLHAAVLGEADGSLGSRREPTLTDPLLAESLDVIKLVRGAVSTELAKSGPDGGDSDALELTHALKIGPPLRPKEISVEHIPSDWRDAEISALFPDASAIHAVTWELVQSEPRSELEWRGHCIVEFASVNVRNKQFSNLQGCTDVFVGYDWEVAEEVNEELLKQLASEFGVVNHARIPAKFRPPFKKDEKTRPFGFVSFAHREDAVKMGRKKSLRAPGTGADGRVVLLRPKLGKHLDGPLKRVPVKIGALVGIFCHFLVYMSLPAHFPIVRPGCTEVSTKFFDCFREACQPEGNVEKARTAVQRCEKELEEYNKCFEESLKGRAQPVVLTRWEQVEEMLKDDD